MYKDSSQLRIEDFVFPYGTLDQENDWVRLAQIVPWETIEEGYAAQFVNNGHPAHPSRMAFGALAIKQRMKCSDEWGSRPGRKSCVKADKRQSRERGQIEGQPVLGTGRLNQAYPPVFRDGRRYARAA